MQIVPAYLYSEKWEAERGLFRTHYFDVNLRFLGHISIQFSRSVVSDSLWPHGLQHTNSQSSPKPTSIESVMPSNHLILVPFSFCPQSFPASGSFQMSQFFTSGGQRIGVSASTSVLPIRRWGPRTDLLLGWTGWISLQSKGLSRVFSNTTVQKHQFFHAQPSL